MHWAEGLPIGTEDNLRGFISLAGHDPDAVLAAARSAEVKQGLKIQTDRAEELGIVGSPTFLVAGELFWGDDRLEQALGWARDRREVD